jgi:integrase
MQAGVLTPKGLIKHLSDAFGHLRVDQLDRYHLAEYLRANRGRRSPATLTKELNRLRSAVRWAKRNLRECAHLDDPPEFRQTRARPRQNFWSPEEIQAITATATLEAPDTEIEMAVYIAAMTGARFDVITELTWDRVSLRKRLIDFAIPGRPDTNKRPQRACPMSDNLVQVLSRFRLARKDNRLFHLQKHVLRKGLAALLTRCGLDGTGTFHTFRHSWATNALAAGMSVHGVAEHLALSPATVLNVYGKADATQVAKAIAVYS